VTGRKAAKAFVDGFLVITVMLIILICFAATTHGLIGRSFSEVALAYFPGGIEAITIITLKYGIDAVYVVAHHIVRVIVAQTAPFLSIRYRRAQ